MKILFYLTLLLSIIFIGPAFSAEGNKNNKNKKNIRLIATTTTEDSGLLGYLLPKFTAQTHIKVHSIALPTGQAIRAAKNGDGDLLLVHDNASELKFMAEGDGIERHSIMYNDFIIIGPKSDPANIKYSKNAVLALDKIKHSNAVFISRGDQSGTHKMELKLWKQSGIDSNNINSNEYRESGSGMGATLNIAAAMNAYTLTDRGTWLSFKNRKDLVLLAEFKKALINQYSIILLNPEKHPHIHQTNATILMQWLISETGQKAIADFKINQQTLFIPNSKQYKVKAEQ